VEAESLAAACLVFVPAEDCRAAGVQDPSLDELVDQAAWLVARVKLDKGLGPQQASPELVLNVLGNPPIRHLKEATGVVGVVGDELLPELEDIHRVTWLPRVSVGVALRTSTWRIGRQAQIESSLVCRRSPPTPGTVVRQAFGSDVLPQGRRWRCARWSSSLPAMGSSLRSPIDDSGERSDGQRDQQFARTLDGPVLERPMDPCDGDCALQRREGCGTQEEPKEGLEATCRWR